MPIYLDYAASTPLDPRVAKVMAEAAKIVGNPSATHSFGRATRQAVDAARGQVAAFLGAEPFEITFTSGATEANNAAVLGVIGSLAKKYPNRRLHALVSPLEHASADSAFQRAAEAHSLEIERLPIDARGIVAPGAVVEMARPETVMVACVAVNNVLGSVQPLAALRKSVDGIISSRGKGGLPLFLFSDAVQAARSDVAGAAHADILTLSAHKMYGPKGVGALRMRAGVPFEPLLTGGGQEEGRRSGTENVAGIAGFGQACLLSAQEREEEVQKSRSTADRIIAELGSVRGIHFLGAEGAAPGILFLQSDRFSGEDMALKLDAAGFAVSTGSACDAGKRQSPAAVKAVFGERAASRGGIRVSWGRFTTDGDIEAFVEAARTLHG